MLVSILATIGSAHALWGCYVVVMALKRARSAGKMSKAMLAMGYPYAIGGIVVDVLFNLIVGTLVFIELPREWTVSARLTRHFNTGSGWRYRIAAWALANLLDALDPTGLHRSDK